MGAFKYAPKHYNPNWSSYSAKRKRWEDANKKKQPSTPRSSTKPTSTMKPKLKII